MAWTEAQILECVLLGASGEILNKDIAERVGKRPADITYMLKRHGFKNEAARKIMGKWNAKHAHLREPAMRYFLDHTFDETCKRFKLTKSELKSLMTVSYRDPRLKHLRKDKRNHSPWSSRELKFLLQHAGLRPRDWIARRLKRGNSTCMKERLQVLGVSSRTMNGITLTQFRDAFAKEPTFYLETDAGPGRGGTPTYFKIIPWVWLDAEMRARRLRSAPIFRELVRSMAVYQEWIFEGDALEKMKRICRQ